MAAMENLPLSPPDNDHLTGIELIGSGVFRVGRPTYVDNGVPTLPVPPGNPLPSLRQWRLTAVHLRLLPRCSRLWCLNVAGWVGGGNRNCIALCGFEV